MLQLGENRVSKHEDPFIPLQGSFIYHGIIFHPMWFEVICKKGLVLTVRRGCPCGLEAIKGHGKITPEAQVELVGFWEDGIGQSVAAEPTNQRRLCCTAISDL